MLSTNWATDADTLRECSDPKKIGVSSKDNSFSKIDFEAQWDEFKNISFNSCSITWGSVSSLFNEASCLETGANSSIASVFTGSKLSEPKSWE